MAQQPGVQELQCQVSFQETGLCFVHLQWPFCPAVLQEPLHLFPCSQAMTLCYSSVLTLATMTNHVGLTGATMHLNNASHPTDLHAVDKNEGAAQQTGVVCHLKPESSMQHSSGRNNIASIVLRPGFSGRNFIASIVLRPEGNNLRLAASALSEPGRGAPLSTYELPDSALAGACCSPTLKT